MSDHLSDEQVQSLQQRKLSPAAILPIHRHLAECAECRSRAQASADTVVAGLRSDLEAAASEEWIHSTYEDLQGLVDETLAQADRENVESHLEVCTECGAAERDLRRIQWDLKTTSAPALRRPLQTVWWSAAAVAAALIILSYVAMLPMRDRVARLEAQIKTLEDEKGRLEQQARDSARQVQDLQNRMADFRQQSRGNVEQAASDSQIQRLAPEYQAMIAAVVARKELRVPPFVSGLIGPGGQLLGPAQNEEFSLVKPVSTGVESETPLLRWTPLEGADSYIVSVFDSQFELVAKSDPLKITEWRVNRPLRRGQSHAWQVVASRNGQEVKSPMPPAPPAMFQVLEKEKAAELAKIRQQLDSPLALGILLAHFGALDDAEEQLRLAMKSDASSALAVQLLKQIQSIRHRKL